MISVPTVLVLGAGASMPYGFPSAYQLKQDICREFSGDSPAVRLLHEGSEISKDQFIELGNSLRMSGQPSIDAFLEHRPTFIPVGKLAIAYCLIPHESQEALFNADVNRGGHWYEYLFAKLSVSFEDFKKNRLSIITFNYDRSLEHYLFTAFHHAYGRSHQDSREAMGAVPILHVYGQLSREPHPHSEGRPYEPDRSRYRSIGYAAGGINLLHETEPDLERARELLLAAHRICFLGFGYHELNVQRLSLRNSTGPRTVFGTVRGKVGAEIEFVRHLLSKELLCGDIELGDDDSLHFLRRHLVLG